MFSLLLVWGTAVRVPNGCRRGLVWERHYTDDETSKVIDGPKDVYAVPYYDQNYNYEYNAIVVKGSFCPRVSGTFVFSLAAKASGKIVVDGSDSGDFRSYWGMTTTICDNKEQTGSVNKTLKAHMCYSFEVYGRTGCNLYSRHLKVTITHNGNPYNGDDDLLTCNRNHQCEDGYYGPDCSGVCPYCYVDEGKGYCSNGTAGTGRCICYAGRGEEEYNCGPSPVFTPSSHFTPSLHFTPSTNFTVLAHEIVYRFSRKGGIIWGIGAGFVIFLHPWI